MALNRDYIRQKINSGIKAHKANDNKTAWLHFQAALREDTQNVTALLWLAYLSEDYEKRIFLLNRVLEIEPNNQRALAGLNWAKKENMHRSKTQTGGQSAETPPTPGTAEDQTTKPTATPKAVAALSQKLKKAAGNDDLKKQAKKGTIAQRARRRISPL